MSRMDIIIRKRKNYSWPTFLYFLKGLISGYCQGYRDTKYFQKMKRIIWVHHIDYFTISKKLLKTLEKLMWCTHFIKSKN
jgi:hypothetical protein